MNQKGIIHFLPLIIFTVLILIIFILIPKKNQLPGVSKTIVSTSTPQSTPTTIPSPTPTPTSTPTPKPTNTPIPSSPPGQRPSGPVAVSGPPGAGYSSITVATQKGNFTAKVLSIDLNSVRVVTDTANDGECNDNCNTLTVKDFVTRNNGFAGVNGSYFCPATYPECSTKKNSFDFPVYNSRLGRWINGGNLSWNSRAMVYFDGSGAHYKQNANSFSGGCAAGIVNYPGLIDGGNIQIDDNQSGLSDKQKAKGTKVGIGIRGEKNVMVVIAQNVNMQEFAYIFKSLGATGALNLDTGGSTALYYNGNYLTGPGRAIPNAIVFTR